MKLWLVDHKDSIDINEEVSLVIAPHITAAQERTGFGDVIEIDLDDPRWAYLAVIGKSIGVHSH